jgi:hypothetical protein
MRRDAQLTSTKIVGAGSTFVSMIEASRCGRPTAADRAVVLNLFKELKARVPTK